ncbi:hypothetical protein D9615_009770 [Tricholomella constricta]|uniref:Metalloenzyme domain-containing protein n=1 Tax=Tricholomella constricta TaxID=117010 RepID=A0A8H5GSM1_9AGAR|nr:hypothetical protein D9615_009770 [Tricholomella constricta]
MLLEGKAVEAGDTTNIVDSISKINAAMRTLYRVAKEAGNVLLIMAKHGNTEQTKNLETGALHTTHTTKPVAVIMTGDPRGKGKMGNVAVDPEEMNEKSLSAGWACGQTRSPMLKDKDTKRETEHRIPLMMRKAWIQHEAEVPKEAVSVACVAPVAELAPAPEPVRKQAPPQLPPQPPRSRSPSPQATTTTSAAAAAGASPDPAVTRTLQPMRVDGAPLPLYPPPHAQIPTTSSTSPITAAANSLALRLCGAERERGTRRGRQVRPPLPPPPLMLLLKMSGTPFPRCRHHLHLSWGGGVQKDMQQSRGASAENRWAITALVDYFTQLTTLYTDERLACLRLTERCADIPLCAKRSAKQAIPSLSSSPHPSKISPSACTINYGKQNAYLPRRRSFAEVHRFLQKQVHWQFLKQYIKYDEILDPGAHPQADARGRFATGRGHAADSGGDCEDVVLVVAPPPPMEMEKTVMAASPSRLRESQILPALKTLHANQNTVDAAKDSADLRALMRTALQVSSDVEILEML